MNKLNLIFSFFLILLVGCESPSCSLHKFDKDLRYHFESSNEERKSSNCEQKANSTDSIKPTPSHSSDPNIANIANKFIDTQANWISKRYGVSCSGTGMSLNQDIKKMSWNFHVLRKLTKNEARALLMSCLVDVINSANNDKELKAAFHQDSFSEKNIEIALIISPKNSDVYHPDLTTIGFRRNKFCYYTQDAENVNKGYYTREYESYDDAIAILKEQIREETLLLSPNCNINLCSNIKLELFKPRYFSFADGQKLLLQGTIADGYYYSPNKIFTCQAIDFNQGQYIAQDGLCDEFAVAAFYNFDGDFLKAEILFTPWLEKNLDEETLFKNSLQNYAIPILKNTDHAEGIHILSQEMIDDHTFFATLSINKMTVLRDEYGRPMSSTRGYLIFREDDKIVVLINQRVTLYDQKHNPQEHLEKIKKDLIDFKKTFKFEKNNIK